MIKTYDAIVVGGGASGMMSAILLARNHKNVVLIEKNKQLGKKLAATGNGRCNFTNCVVEPKYYHSNSYVFLSSVLKSFSAKQCVELFHELGIFSREKDGYVYPYTNHSSTVVERLADLCYHYNVTVFLEENVCSVSKEKEYKVRTNKRELFGRAVFLATGGKANAPLGGDGSGYRLSKHFGHHISGLTPGLTGFLSNDKVLKKMSGVRIHGKLSLYIEKQFIKSDMGEIQITKNGVSGIPAFQLCHEVGKALAEGSKVQMTLDFIPILTEKECCDFLQVHSLAGLVNRKCISPIMEKSKTTAPQDVAAILKSFPISIEDTAGFDKAQVTVGGVDVTEINPETMESLLSPGLYLLGELLNVDGNCGGYNLHFAWASAVLAVKKASRSENVSR